MVEELDKEEELDVEKEGYSSNGKGEDEANIILVNALYRTERKRMLEMTNLPLDKQRALTWMKVYVKELFAMCDEIVAAQKRLSARYNEYHAKDEEGNPIPELELKVEWVDNWPKERGMMISLMDEWIYHYCQVRRSKDGDHVKNAVLLSQDQMAVQQGKDSESPFDNVRTS